MTMSLAVTVNPTSIASGDETEVSVQVSNSDTSPIRVVELRPSPAALQRTSMELNGCTVKVPASGSITLKYKVQAFSEAQSIAVRAFSDDGQSASASASLTVT